MLLQTVVIVNYIFQLVWIVLQLVVAGFLSVKMIKTKSYNLIPLILFFLISSLRILIYILPSSTLILSLFLIQLPNISLLIFTKLTFFRKKKSPFKIFLITLIIVRSLDFMIRLNFQISIPMTYPLDESNLIYYIYILFSITISFLLSHMWLGIVALKYYNSLKTINIDPWIKKRYQLIGLGSFVYSFSIFLYYFIPYNVPGAFVFPNIIYGYIVLVFTIYYSLCMFFAWIMPKRLKIFFDKDFTRPIDKEYSESELMDIIQKGLSENK
ncbi:MAG: hypothetical protein ACFFA0_11185 [Promethearchaeota archaeon]